MLSLACKIIIVFFVVSTLPARGNTISEPWVDTGLEEIRVTIDLEDVSLKESLELIKQKCSVTFAYNEVEVDVNIRVNVRFKDIPLNRVLDKILHENNLKYQVQNKCIIILPAEKPLPPVAYGGIKGKVSDASNGETLIGASVIVLGTRQGTITDKNGGFEFKNIPVGEYTLEISYVGYTKKQITGIKVTENNYAVVDIPLETGSVGIDEVKIVANIDVRTAPIINANELTLINSIRESDIMVTGISAEQISKSLDRDAGDVVKRAPGVSMLNKFVMVRGMAPRYNRIFINGMQMSSTESYNRAFSFDLIPSGVIDAIEIYKLPAPELPGGFGGGIIKVKTRQSQAARRIQLKLSGEYDTRYSFTDLYTGSNHASDDWLGMGADDREFPAKFYDETFKMPDAGVYPAEKARLLKTMPPVNDLKKSNHNLNRGIGLNYYDSWLIGHTRINNLTSLNYSYKRETGYKYELTNYPYKDPLKLDEGFERCDTTTAEKVRLNLLQSLNIVFNNSHKISFDLLANRNAVDYTVFGQYVTANAHQWEGGRLGDTIPSNKTLVYQYQVNDVLSGQLSGEHQFGRHVIDWHYGRNRFESYVPDLQRFDFNYFDLLNDTAAWYKYDVHRNSGRVDSRLYVNTTDKGQNGSLNYVYRMNGETTFKAGVSYTEQNRIHENMSYYMVTTTGPGGIYSFDPWLNLGEILGPDAYKEDGAGLDIIRTFDRYYYDHSVQSHYLAVKQRLLNKLEVYGGIRYEYEYVQLYDKDKVPIKEQVFYGSVDGETVRIVHDLAGPYLNHWLPSINLSWELTAKQKLRAGYGKTIDSPFAREHSPLEFYAPEDGVMYQGNKMLKNAELDNMDLRWEFYPSESEFIAAGLFYKYIKNPIENMENKGEKKLIWVPVNYKEAWLYGLELELRNNFAFIPVSWADRFSMITNFTYTYTKMNEVFFSKGSANWVDLGTKKRPMTGSSPYLVNANFYYTDPRIKTQLSLNYNLFGPRLISVGDNEYGNLYQNPHDQLDFALIQPLGKFFTIKVGVQNVFEKEITGWRDMDQDGVKNFEEYKDFDDALYISTRRLVYAGLTVTL